MIFVYNGYTLNIEERKEDRGIRLIGKCEELGCEIKTWGDYNYVINWFKQTVNTYLEAKEKESSAITFTYLYFTSKVSWDSNTCVWLIKHIYDKADKDILQGSILTGKYIQELQGRFEDYIDKYLKERNK